MTYFIHPLADVQTRNIGEGSKIWQYVVVLPYVKIGADVNICAHCFVENQVVIGDRVTLKSGVQVWDGINIGDDVFIGPNVSFSNDRFPRSKRHQEKVLETTIENGASIGAGAVILPGIRIGQNSMIGAGAVVTRSVPSNAIVVGNPARIIGYVDAYQTDVNVEAGCDRIEKQSAVLGVTLQKLPQIIDIRGSLTVGEFERSIPFNVKRYFIVFDVPSTETRGEHAHKVCHQFLLCTHGQVSVLVDDGKNRAEYLLNSPDLGLHLEPMVWGVQYKYSPDAVLLVFASHYYDSSDYIRDYREFLALVGVKNDTVS